MKNSSRSSSRSALRWVLALLVAGLVGACWAPAAHAADNSLKTSTPSNGSQVPQSPANLTLVFNSPIGPTPKVDMTCGTPVQVITLGQALLLADRMTVSVTIPSPVPKGNCTVSWRVTDQSLQPAGNGSFSFSVLNDTVVTTTLPSTSTTVHGGGVATTVPSSRPSTGGGSSSSTTSSGSKGPLALFRLVSILGMSIVLGSLVVIAVAWPEGQEYILTVRFLRNAWALGVVGSYLYAGALASSQSGKGLGASLVPTGWGTLAHTMPGKAALLRFVLVLASGYAAMRPERSLDPSSQVAAFAPPALAVVTVAFSRSQFGIIEWALGALHGLSMAVWIGGLILVVRVVLAGPGESDLVHAVRGFSRISVPVLWITVITGIGLLFRLDRGHLTSSHGLVLIVKTLTVALMVFVGIAVRQFVHQRLKRSDSMSAPMAVRLRRALGIEAALGIVVLVLTAWLLTLAPPGLAVSAGSNLSLGSSHRFNNTGMGVDVRVRFTEKVGLNDVRIEVVTPTSGLSGLAVDFIPPVGSSVNGMSISPIPLGGTGVAVLAKSAGFSLSTSGTWKVVVRVGNNQVGAQDIYVAGGSGVSSATTLKSGA